MIAALRYLAEMFEHVGKPTQAKAMNKRASELKQRLDQLSWNGRFYRHHFAEDSSVQRDHGVDLEEQMSMSNAYALNRCLTQEQCAAVISEYQKIRSILPQGSAGEWYSIFPWFGKNGNNGPGEYMNGGVNTIVAGELARGAFEHVFEDYGVDILRRIKALAEGNDGFLDFFIRGVIEDRAESPIPSL